MIVMGSSLVLSSVEMLQGCHKNSLTLHLHAKLCSHLYVCVCLSVSKDSKKGYTKRSIPMYACVCANILLKLHHMVTLSKPLARYTPVRGLGAAAGPLPLS